MTLSEELMQMKGAMKLHGRPARTDFALPIRRHKRAKGTGVIVPSAYHRGGLFPVKSQRVYER